MKRFFYLIVIICALPALSMAQNVFSPSDPIVRYNASAPYGSAQRPDTNRVGLQKWVANSTNGVSSGTGAFDASSFKAYYVNYYNSRMAFRLKFPRSYNNPDSVGKKYPVMLFMHGAGEVGCTTNGGIYNNEKQLVHGGKVFMDRVDNNQFDGFLLYPQLRSPDGQCWGEWGSGANARFNAIITFIDSLVKYTRLDNDRVFVAGLSGGAVASWRLAENYPTRIAKIAPTSGAGLVMNYSAFVHIPVWLATGGKDNNPSPAMASYSELKVSEIGGSIRRTLYPDLGHSSWYRHWAEPDFVPNMNDVHKANPLIFFNRFEFCPDSGGVDARLGITGSYYAYEWQKDGQLIATRTGTVNTVLDANSVKSFTGNEINVKDFGTYRVRFRRTNNGIWSAWSPKPAVITSKNLTQTPPIVVSGIKSKVLPSLDGKTTVTLTMPEGFVNYQWVRTTDNAVVANTQVFEAPLGTYKARYSENYGCGTMYSPVFKVVNAAGTPKPDAAKNLSVTTVSQSVLRLDWNDNPNATVNETGFEVYRSIKAGGPYQLVAITNPDVIAMNDSNLVPNSTYYYVIRSVSETGAAVASEENSGKTDVDKSIPGAPSNLQYRGSTSTSVSLRWNAANDDGGIGRYDIYANGVKLYSTSGLSFTVANLDSLTSYAFFVKAVDKAGNVSPNSNQVIGFTHRQGLEYKYYHGSYSTLPNFNNLTPVKTGIMDTVNTGQGVRTRDDGFAFFWSGNIYIPVAATYTFETNSDDGSKLYIDKAYSSSATPLVNNDGAHSAQIRTGSMYLTQGYHSFIVTYADVSGDEAMDLYWSNNAGLTRERIPKNFFSLDQNTVGGNVTAPGFLSATAVSYNKIKLDWSDLSDNETGFEIVRSNTANGTYLPVATASANSTTFTDSGLNASTRYYYMIRAISSSGQSDFIGLYPEANWKFNNNYSEAGGAAALVASNTSFSSSDKAEGSHSVVFTNNDYISFSGNSSAFPSQGGYTQRTVALWIKPSATNNRRMIYESGGNDNGMGIRFNSDDLQGAVASGSSRQTITFSNFASSNRWRAGQWNHVALVFKDNTLRLYLNAVQVASNTNLPFTSVGNSGNASLLGNRSNSNSNASVFNDGSYTTYLGSMDDLYIINGQLNETGLTDMMNLNMKSSTAVTPAAPGAPAVPNGLQADVLSTHTIRLSWNDQSSNETGFEIWRATGDKTNYRAVATVEGGAGSQKEYTDTTLFANVTYFFKVRALGQVSPSAFSQEVNAKTKNSLPVIKEVSDFFMRHSTTFNLKVSAKDPDGDVMTFGIISSPAFATLQPVSNGNAEIIFSPSSAAMGTYPMGVWADDGNGGRDTTLFTLTVNDNAVPQLSALQDSVMNEGESVTIAFSAIDSDAPETLVYTVDGLPSFGTFTDHQNGTATLVLQPGFAAAGHYNLTVTVTDAYGAWSARNMKLTVADMDPEEVIQFNFRFQSAPVSGWNSVNLANNTFTHGAVTDTKMRNSSITLSLASGAVQTSSQGPQTKTNTGVYPDLVMKDMMRWGFSIGTNTWDTIVIKVAGLSPQKQYDFVFYAGYLLNGDANSVTKYVIGNDTASVQYWYNATLTDTLSGAWPNAAGEIDIKMIGDVNRNWGGLLNAMVIRAKFEDGSLPVKPGKFTATQVLNSGVELNWEDLAFNEAGYHVYRSTDRNNGYVLINEGLSSKDSTSFLDDKTAPETDYYYFVAGFNGSGMGTTTDTLKVTTGNNKPVLALTGEVLVKAGSVHTINFSATDDPGDVVTVTIQDKPGFVSLQSHNGGQYSLTFTPTNNHLGAYVMTVKAVDQKGAATIRQVQIGVADKNTRSVFINFGSTGKNAPLPWNNWLNARVAGNTISNLKDEANVTTPFSVTLVNSWSAFTDMGHLTGNNTGIYSDSVLQSGLLDNNSLSKTIRVFGLDNSRKYNIVLVASQNEGTASQVEYVSGTAVDTLDAKYNMHQSANLNGLTPVNGELIITATRLTGTTVSILNALVIEEVESAVTVLQPYHLYAEAAGRNSVQLIWNDRADNEDVVSGYVLERATDSLFNLNLASVSLPGNTSGYLMSGLSPNTRYWFRIRARTATNAFSDYSNRATAFTAASVVAVNFNYTLPDAAYPWNNTFSSPTFEGSFGNLINQSGAVSGLTLTLTKVFNGEFTAGVKTGNNSGVVPDNVLAANYWIDNSQISQFKLSGLNHSRRYRIGFIGSSSSAGWFKGNYTCTYTVNGQTVYLNSWMNSSKVVYLDNLAPDQNGELYLDFSTTAAALYGFNAGIIIEDYLDPQQINTMVAGNSLLAPVLNSLNAAVTESQALAERNKEEMKLYPNPFTDRFNVAFYNPSATSPVSLEVYDLSGRIIYNRNPGRIPAGFQTIGISSNEAGMTAGIYLVVVKSNGVILRTGKAIRAGR